MPRTTTSPWSLIARPDWVFFQQQAYKAIGHGKLCPWCKTTIMWSCNMVLVQRLPIPRVKDQEYPSKVYYDKRAWDWVCSESCARAMGKQWADGHIARQKLATTILANPLPKAIPRKSNEQFRQSVLRLARIADDPGFEIIDPVKHPFPIRFPT